MANKVARFYKVSYEQFKKDFLDCFNNVDMVTTLGMIKNLHPSDSQIDDAISDVYENIMLPKRATTGSAGYDFFTPVNIILKPGETVKIPTGIRVQIKENWVLKLYPKSGLGFKFRLQLNNTVGIIDSDYFNAKNEGHIMAKITNDSNEERIVDLSSGKGFMQGIFVEYGITVDDEAEGVRVGGFGSTNS